MTTGSIELGVEKYIRILSVIFIFLSVIFSIFLAKTKYRFSIFFAYLVLILTVILNYLISGADLSDMTQFMANKGIGPWICLGLIFVGYNDNRYYYFQKFLLFAILFISILSIYSFVDFGVGMWRGQALSKYQIYSVNLVWLAPYTFLTLKNNQKLKWIRLLVLFIGIILALVTQTRSFLIIYFITLLFDFYHTKNKRSYFFVLVFGIVGLAYLILNTKIFSTSLELLIDRGTQDTRTLQLEVFLAQLDFFGIISGNGHFANYRFGNELWTAVDNQWLFLLWWGGIIPVICYFFLCVVVPVKMIFKGKLSYETKVECYVLIMWSLGLTGLAIFSTMSVEFFFFIISIILGRVLHKYSTGQR